MLRLKIDFHRSEICYLGDSVSGEEGYKWIFTRDSGISHMKYLGLTVDAKRLSGFQWNPMVEKVGKRMVGWKENSLSIT